jgi:hypothetical protein
MLIGKLTAIQLCMIPLKEEREGLTHIDKYNKSNFLIMLS